MQKSKKSSTGWSPSWKAFTLIGLVGYLSSEYLSLASGSDTLLSLNILFRKMTEDWEARPEHMMTELEPNAFKSTVELVRSWGYPCERHFVYTDDGYILEIHRIPHGVGGVVPSGWRYNSAVSNSSSFWETSPGSKGVVLLTHGLTSSSAATVLNLPHQNLALILADAGYDVWLGNFRGNDYGKRHLNLSHHDYSFWEFSWDEMAEFDNPATIDYILSYTNQSSLYYIGHSMGSTAAYAMLATQPQYNDKIKYFVALSPAVRFHHSRRLWGSLAPFMDFFQFGHELLHIGQWSKRGFHQFISDVFCYQSGRNGENYPESSRYFCESYYSVLFGFNFKHVNLTRHPIYTAHLPTSCSTRTFIHFGQLLNSGLFRKFDFGRRRNLEKYGQEEPPVYDLSRVSTPIAIFYGIKDRLVHHEDAQYLGTMTPNTKKVHLVDSDNWDHADFLVAIDAPSLVYSHVIELLSEH